MKSSIFGTQAVGSVGTAGTDFTALLTTTVFLLLHLPKQVPMVNTEVIPLLTIFINQLEVLPVFMTLAMETIVMLTYSRPIQNSSVVQNSVDRFLVQTAAVELHSSQL